MYAVSSRKALKLSLNAFGAIQNKAEFIASQERSTFISRCFESAEDFSWITAELVNPIENIYDVYRYLGISIDSSLKALFDLAKKCQLMDLLNTFRTEKTMNA